MILNTFFKTRKITLSKKQKSWLGRNIVRSYKCKYPDAEIKKVNISENGCKMEVVDYPKDFLESEGVKKIIKRFMNKLAKTEA